MAITQVQYCSGSSTNNIATSSTVTKTATATFGSSTTAGAVLVAFVSGNASFAGNAVTSVALTDSQGNAWTQAAETDASGSQNPMSGVFYASGIAGGACTVTVSASESNTNPIFVAIHDLCLVAVELAGGSVAGFVGGTQNPGAGSYSLSVALANLASTTITSSSGTTSQNSLSVADLHMAGADVFVAAASATGLTLTEAGDSWTYSTIATVTSGGGQGLIAQMRAGTITTFSTAFRKTRSFLGTKTGSRQAGRC